ncbi:probable peroxidase 26 [Primulina eburnea]|uniref:probable peroxidase 26 n=1 Tax=Primulina eburnea TaxID=1245227 RepID=UPI003C6BF745
MERRGYNFVTVICMVVGVGLSLYVSCVHAAVTLPPEDKPLKRHFYKKLKTCANVEAFVKHQVQLWWDKDKSITAKLLKLLYADCMVNGCDGSILLDGPRTEKNATKNSRLDGFILIDKIKKVVEARCPEAVSCTDILVLSVRDAVHLAGAPSYPVFLGRRDGLESKAAWVDLPSPSVSWEEGYAYFKSKGLDAQDYATLLGAHTLGKTHCEDIHDRLYDYNKTQKADPTMSRLLLEKLRQLCPSSSSSPSSKKKSDKDPTIFLTDKNGDAYSFTNTYYSNVLSYDSVLGVDQQLLFNYNTSQLVLEYAEKFESFRREFTLSISRMGGLGVLTGKQGEIRKNCRLTNNNNPDIK